MSRPRFTIRSLLVAIAIVAALCFATRTIGIIPAVAVFGTLAFTFGYAVIWDRWRAEGDRTRGVRIFTAATIVTLATAIVISAATLKRKSDNYMRMAMWHYDRIPMGRNGLLGVIPKGKRWEKHHYQLGDKYRRAARYPWLPVAADPPEPE